MSNKPLGTRFTRTIRFSEHEWRAILDLADDADVKPTVFVRRSALGQRLQIRPTTEHRTTARALVDHDRQLAWIGNNLNQLVRLAHGGRVQHDRDFLDVLATLRRDLDASRGEVKSALHALLDPEVTHDAD